MTSQVNTTLGTNGKAQSKSSMLVCTSFSLSPLEVISWGSYLLLKHLLYDKINLVPQTWSQLHFSHVGKHKFYSLTSTQFLWDHQFRRIMPKLLKKCDIIRLKYFFPSWLIIAWRILFWEKLKTLSLTIPQWFKIPTTAKMLYMSKPIHMPPI